MKKITLRCKIITQLFMGGAEQQPELRTQSFNGLFRYWFRLLGGSFEDEKRLFGWGGEKANRGIVNIIIKNQHFRSSEFRKKSAGYNYLGFSLYLTKRKGIEPSGKFDLIFSFHPVSTEEDIKKFLCAVWCAFYLGNFGSRSRKGFGSIVVEDISKNVLFDFKLKFKPQQREDINIWLKNQLNYIKSLNYWRARRDIPYIFENLNIYKFSQINNDYIRILNEMGNKYQEFRKSLRNSNWKDRIWFGLPIIRKNKLIAPQIKDPQIKKDKSLRRASPLIFKIIQFNNTFGGFILFFRPNENHNFKFLPDNTKINFTGVDLSKPNWSILDNFINNLVMNRLIEKIYP